MGFYLHPSVAVPTNGGSAISRSHAAIHLLAVLDTLNLAHDLNVKVSEDDVKKSDAVTYSREDYSVVNRFESHGGGWGYSGHSVEAIRFMADMDVLLGGFGLFGGRGEYLGKIKGGS